MITAKEVLSLYENNNNSSIEYDNACLEKIEAIIIENSNRHKAHAYITSSLMVKNVQLKLRELGYKINERVNFDGSYYISWRK